MNSFCKISCLVFLFSFNLISAQSFFGVEIPDNSAEQCKQCTDAFRKKPKEVSFGIKTDDRDVLYFEINNEEWLDKIFKDPKDGIMLDIVSKERYDCSKETLPPSNYGIVGTTLKPIFTKEIKRGLKKQANGRFRVKVGIIPANLRGKELEFNAYFINDNYFCRYSRVFDLKSYPLDLLDTGMYLDELTYLSEIKSPSEVEGFKLKYKTLQFTIPFQKNKSEYSAADIKPVYDSLHLTNFNIKSIDIKAYSSVEGSVERNKELQEQRATSIAKALQEFQTPTIDTKIAATENWVEFFNDVEKTKYASFADLSQHQIKAKLNQSEVNSALEPYLKNHRKALIILELQKKDSYKTMDPKQLVGLFKKSISETNIDEAIKLQNAIFERVKIGDIPPEMIDELGVPSKKEFALLANNNSALRCMLDQRQVLISYNRLLALDKLLPGNKKIKYNICVTKFVLWQYNAKPITIKEIENEIYGLKNYGVSQLLIDRMLINFNLIKSKKHMQKGDFSKKDKAVNYIYSKYKDRPLRDADFLNLANYFSSFSNYDLAQNLLKDRVRNFDVSEDLLFFYLNLTIINKELTKEKEYKTMMLNANSKNPKRFCELFNPFGKGGIMFQLLEDDSLRKIYCENCAN